MNVFEGYKVELGDGDIDNIPTHLVDEYLQYVVDTGLERQYELKRKFLQEHGYDPSVVREID